MPGIPQSRLEFGRLHTAEDRNRGKHWLAHADGAITRNDVVVFTGTRANYASVSQADADTAPLSQGVLLVAVTMATAAGDEVLCAEMTVLQNVNTGGSTIGNPVYLSQTAGGWTLTRPASPANQVIVGRVLVVDATAGVILLAPAYAQNDPADSDLLLTDNVTRAYALREGSNDYVLINTTDNQEAIVLGPDGPATATVARSVLMLRTDSANPSLTVGADLGGGPVYMRTAIGSTSVAHANAGALLDIGTGGGGASATAGIAGGAGGALVQTTGVGGASTNSGIGGAGGAYTLTAGNGGAHSASGAGGGGGNGGAVSLTSGDGGANSFAAGSAASGRGGDFAINTGVGGATSGAAATGAGGRGGDSTVTLGAGGVQSVGTGAGGRGGAFGYVAGAGGANTFAGASAAGGAGGGFTLTGGVGGATASTGADNGGAGGGYSATFGNGGAQTGAASAGNGGLGGGFTIACGVGGNQSGGTGLSGAGGAVSITAGAAGTQSGGAGAGGIGGDVTMVSGAGGANSFAGASAAGGRGGVFSVTSGAGGATASTGAHLGGVGGDYTILLGNGGAQTGAGAGQTGGRGGNYSLTTGNGGASTNGIGGAGGAYALVAGNGGNGGTTGGAGGGIAVTAGNAGTGGNVAGGNITLTPGTATGTGTPGTVRATGLRTASVTGAAIVGATALTLADSGGVFSVSQAAAYDIDLPNPTSGPGCRYVFYLTGAAANTVTITTLGGATFVGTIVNDVTSVLPATGSTLSFITGTAALGDTIECISISTSLYLVRAVSSTAGGITIA